MNDCVFCKIRDREIAKEFTYEDSDIMVFPDIHPIKKVHLLIVPKIHMEDFLDPMDLEIWGKIKDVLQKMIREKKIEDKGYRVVINGGGAQIIQHLHIHLTSPWGKEE